MANVLGLDAKFYIDEIANIALPVWAEMSNCKDLTLGLEKNEADVTTRASNGWRATVAVLKDATVEFKMVHDPDDTGFTAISDAFFSGDPILGLVLSGDKTDAKAVGLEAVFAVMSFTRNEPLEEALTIDVKLRPTYYPSKPPAWVTGPIT